MQYRTDHDSLGEVKVPADQYWGPQTQRSLMNFPIGDDQFDSTFIRALAIVKLAAARCNQRLGTLPEPITSLIIQAAEEVLAGKLYDQFPLAVWQTGSGTQSNMNMNEVLANRANQFSGAPLGRNTPVHPNDHVNCSQSSNDVFPTAMHIATVIGYREQLRPALQAVLQTFRQKAEDFADVVKIGRTHMMDATPMTLGQEFSGYSAQIEYAMEQLDRSADSLLPLALGGTAVGTGINAPEGWADAVAQAIAEQTQLPFTSAVNKFAALSSHDALLGFSGHLKQTACVGLVIGNNLRLLASGPRCGLAEITLPANEPGSSIMPGKVNPTQIEALTMVAAQVIGNDAAVTVGASQAHLQLNVFKPLIIHNILRSIRLLGDALTSFDLRCARGIEANQAAIDRHAEQSLMLVTALSPQLGYDCAASVAKQAFDQNKTLKQVLLERQLVTEQEVDNLLDPRKMLGKG